MMLKLLNLKSLLPLRVRKNSNDYADTLERVSSKQCIITHFALSRKQSR